MATAYAEKLKDPRWQKKRLTILKRDKWVCQNCYDNESTLVVHHRRYLPDKEPWDYPNHLLVTLCEECHENERTERAANESDLIAMLREKFSAEDIHSLATGFHLMELMHVHEVVSSVYEWALSSPVIQRELIDRYFAYIKEKAHASKKTD